MTQTISTAAPKTDATAETGRLRSVLVMEKGRPINVGVPMDIYAAGQLTAGSGQDAATMEPTMADAHTEYIYDQNGKLEKTIKTNNSNGKITTYYYYDSYGRLTKTVEDRSEYGRFDGGQALYGLEYETRYTYNDSARTITIESESTKKDSGLGANLITETYYCDESGRIVKCSLRSGSDYTYVYDENGQVIRSEMRGADGSLATYTEYIYQ